MKSSKMVLSLCRNDGCINYLKRTAQCSIVLFLTDQSLPLFITNNSSLLINHHFQKYTPAQTIHGWTEVQDTCLARLNNFFMSMRNEWKCNRVVRGNRLHVCRE